MGEDLQQKLRSQLWTVANTLRGNMYFSLGFIFYKYLSEKIELYVNDELEADETTFQKVWQSDDEAMKEEIKAMCVDNLVRTAPSDRKVKMILEVCSLILTLLLLNSARQLMIRTDSSVTYW